MTNRLKDFDGWANRRVLIWVNRARAAIIAEDAEHGNRERAAAAAAYAWLGSIHDDAYASYRKDRLLTPFMFSLLYRLWPRTWSGKLLHISTRRRNLIRAAALILLELENIEKTRALEAMEKNN